TKPRIPDIEGAQGKRIYNSTTLMELEEKPGRLAIVGGGFVGLEFADMFLKFGSEVTLLDRSETFLPKEDRDMAEAIRDLLVHKGLNLVSGVTVDKFRDSEAGVEVLYNSSDHQTLVANAVLL